MNIHIGIIDQQVRGIADKNADLIKAAIGKPNAAETDLRSAAFLLLCVRTLLDLSDDEALECFTEGGGDFGVDAIEISEPQDGEFTATLFQAKYKADLSGTSNFPENAVGKVIDAVRYLFDPASTLQLNPRLSARVEEIRSLIADSVFPRVRVVLCNNGLRWSEAGQKLIEQAGFSDRVSVEHVNHDTLVDILQAAKKVSDTLQFGGKAIVEDFNFIRLFIGRMPVTEIAALLHRHGDALLDRNVRRYLGLHGNRVNEGIRETLRSDKERANFYFYNNGITLTCTRFDYNSLQGGDFKVRVEDLQIINGGQTCKTIETTLEDLRRQPNLFPERMDDAQVLVRLYQLPADSEDLASNITYATNSQNPVDLRDLRSNDSRQKSIEAGVQQLGFSYRRKRVAGPTKSEDITAPTAAEAVLAVWLDRPHHAKFRSREHFGKLYETIFAERLNASQLVCAVLLLRIAENKRKRPPTGSPNFLAYGSYFLAMLMGRYLLRDLGVALAGLDHRTFSQAKKLIEDRGEQYFTEAVKEVEGALGKLYGGQSVTLQRLSATFRRGDLITELAIPVATPAVGKAPGP